LKYEVTVQLFCAGWGTPLAGGRRHKVVIKHKFKWTNICICVVLVQTAQLLW